MSSFIQGNECAVCTKPATGFEPRFGYFYCAEHERTPPVDIPALTELSEALRETRERAHFEEFISAPPFECSIARCTSESAWPGGYVSISVALAWEAWQERASRAA